MASLIAIRRYPQGRRMWVVGQRLHHGATGCAMLSLVLTRRTRPLALIGAALIAHDRADWRIWFSREGLPVTAGELLDAELSIV